MATATVNGAGDDRAPSPTDEVAKGTRRRSGATCLPRRLVTAIDWVWSPSSSKARAI